jgi:hypothetical protein
MPIHEARQPCGRAFFVALVAAAGQLACCVAGAQQAAELQLGRSGTLAIPLSPGVNQVPPSLGSRALMTFETLPGRTQLMLSPMPLPQPPSKREVCNVVENGSSEVRAKAVERELLLLDLKGPEVEGCYYAATDRAPKQGEHKYLYQGAVAARDVVVMFTILFNDGAEKEAQAALATVRGIKLVPPK